MVQLFKGNLPSDLDPVATSEPGSSIFQIYAAFPEVTKLVKAALSGVVGKTVVEHKDGPWEYNVFPVEEQSGSVTGVIGLVQHQSSQASLQWYQAALLDTAAELRKARNHQEMPVLIFQKLGDILDIDQAGIVFGTENDPQLEILGLSGNWSQAKEQENLFSEIRDPAFIQVLIATKKNNHLESEPQQVGSHIAAFPFQTEEGFLGALCVGRKQRFQSHESDLLWEISAMLSSALQRARQHEQTEKNLARLSAIHSIDQAISGNFNLNLTLHIILDQVVSQLQVDAADIFLYDPDTQEMSFAYSKGFRHHMPSEDPTSGWENLVWRTMQKRDLLAIPDLKKEGLTLARSGLFAAEGFHSYFALPLIAKGVCLGVLEVFHRSPPRFDDDWIQFLRTLGTQAAIAIDISKLVENLRRTNLQLDQAYQATLEGWVRALDLRDQCTEQHTQRVVDASMKLALAAGVAEKDLIHFRRGALLHDIGKLGVPDSILNKPGELTPEEWTIMKKHPEYAQEMLKPIEFLRPALPIPYSHHEKWDGSGYPEGKKRTGIPIEARVFAIIDVWDALNSPRPYRDAWPERKIHHYIREQAGTHFDPSLVRLWEKVFQIPD
jgi:GAF domain-containing protein